MTRQGGLETSVHQPHQTIGPSHAAGLERKIKRAAHPGDPELLGNARNGFEYGRKQVRMFMGIQMRWV
jgi:hypothetical protein